MSGDYHILANIHDALSMGVYARTLTPRLINYAQQNGWMGRRISDLGCGAGEGSRWLSQHGYVVTGVDRSADMLALAQAEPSSVTWLQQDIRQLSNIGNMDMVLALDVLHELRSLRDLETIFQKVYTVLNGERLFIFDLYTIEGLVHRNTPQAMMEFDDDHLVVFSANQHDYERQVQTRMFHIFYRDTDDGWQRHSAHLALRSYPVQAVTALLQRSNFHIAHVLDENLNDYAPEVSTSRVIIMAQKR